MSAISNRYEFVYFFDVTNGNPNGDPDAGGLPRVDPETSHGLVTDVCLKRKLRNFVSFVKEGEPGFAIYVQEKAVLNHQHHLAYDALKIKPESKKLPKDKVQANAVTSWMSKNFFDIRTFGAVMTTEVNSGQVRGPVQFAFASSVDPVMPMEISITRMAVTNEKDIEKGQTMGRKHIIPYGLYRAHGFVSAKLAERSGFSEDDLALFWQGLINMFEHDRSATRGEMTARKLIVFKHDSALGNAPAHVLFDTVKVSRLADNPEQPARIFSDYQIKIDKSLIPAGVSVVDLI